MAILFTGIVMSHYTHSNLSPVAQITVQQTFRTISFIAGKELVLTKLLPICLKICLLVKVTLGK